MFQTYLLNSFYVGYMIILNEIPYRGIVYYLISCKRKMKSDQHVIKSELPRFQDICLQQKMFYLNVHWNVVFFFDKSDLEIFNYVSSLQMFQICSIIEESTIYFSGKSDYRALTYIKIHQVIFIPFLQKSFLHLLMGNFNLLL